MDWRERTVFIFIMIQVTSLTTISVLAQAGGGQCLSQAQQVTCRETMTHMVEAEENGDKKHICRTFGDLHTCILQAMSTCPYNSKEKKLYEMDIVEHYIRKPFSCALIGGNLEFKAEYNGGGNKQASVYTMIHIVLYVLYKTVTFSGF